MNKTIKIISTCVTRDMKSYKKGQIYSVSDDELKLFNAGFYEIVEEKKTAEKSLAPKKRTKKC